jgi:N-acyl-D-amino-acid deacylase
MILIKDSLVVDGTGAPAQRADIVLKDDRIVAIGNLKNHEADVVIDGLGTITTPGFIDVNTDSDHYVSLFTDPLQQDFLKQGVTTIIGGHCGSSLAPLLYGTLESIRKWGDTSGVNVNWNTMAEFLKTLERLKLGVNFGTLVGHATIRRALIGEVSRDLTEREMEVFAEIVTSSLKEGALGLSTGLGYSHGRGTPYGEIKALVDIVAKYNSVYATHLRNEREDIVNATKEAMAIAKDTGAKTLISHFRPIVGFETEFEKALMIITDPMNRSDIHFDLYPFNYSILPIYTLLPAWAHEGSLEEMYAQVSDEHMEAEIIKDIPSFKSDDLIIARATGFDYLVGKTVGEFAKGQGMTLKKGLLQLMRLTKLKAVLFHKNINLGVAQNALLSDRALVASNSPSLLENKNVLENDRAQRTFTEFLHLLSQFKKKSLEWAVAKITSEPARKFNLKDRGVLKAGAIADLVMMRPMIPNAPLGGDNKIVHVFVGGQLVVKDGETTGLRAGQVIRRS